MRVTRGGLGLPVAALVRAVRSGNEADIGDAIVNAERALGEAAKPGISGLPECSFCGRSQREAKKLIAGPTVYICDDCGGLVHDILVEDAISEPTKTDPDLVVDIRIRTLTAIADLYDSQAKVCTGLSGIYDRHARLAREDAIALKIGRRGSDEVRAMTEAILTATSTTGGGDR